MFLKFYKTIGCGGFIFGVSGRLSVAQLPSYTDAIKIDIWVLVSIDFLRKRDSWFLMCAVTKLSKGPSFLLQLLCSFAMTKEIKITVLHDKPIGLSLKCMLSLPGFAATLIRKSYDVRRVEITPLEQRKVTFDTHALVQDLEAHGKWYLINNSKENF